MLQSAGSFAEPRSFSRGQRGGALAHGTPETNTKRKTINAWIRASRALRDPSDPSRLAARYDSGDQLHPSSAGYRRMARAVRVARLEGPQCRGRPAGSARSLGRNEGRLTDLPLWATSLFL